LDREVDHRAVAKVHAIKHPDGEVQRPRGQLRLV
jgi:hypothetical protein